MIDTGHGIVRGANSSFSHRNLFDRDAFAEHLRRRAPKYMPLATAIAGSGSALTFDDATLAGADAARLARQYGHHVTLFVNGYNVERQVPYFFARLNAALDAAQVDAVDYDGERFALLTRKEKTAFRKRVKRKLAAIGPEAERQALIDEVAGTLGVARIAVPEHFRTLTVPEIRALLDLGVDIQNHGWTHTRVGALPDDEQVDDIRRGRDWLRDTFGISSDIYAVPNGDGRPVAGWREACRYWLLLDEKPLGQVAPGVISRRTLTLVQPPLQKLRSLARRSFGMASGPT